MRYDYEGKPFTAYDRDGRGYQVSPVYRFDANAADPRRKTFLAGSCVGLLTEDGRWVRREKPGEYLLLGTESVRAVRLMAYGEAAV